jgi:hypothetical protein
MTHSSDSNRDLIKGLTRAVEILGPRFKTLLEIDDPNERTIIFDEIVDSFRKNNHETALDLVEANRGGLLLLLSFSFVVDTIVERTDLSRADRYQAGIEAHDFLSLFQIFRQAQYGLCSRELVFQFALAALFTGLSAGLSPTDVSKLRKCLPAELGRSGGRKSGESRREKAWMSFAKGQALAIYAANRFLTLDDVASSIEKKWEKEPFVKVGRRRITQYLSNLIDAGHLPTSLRKRTASRQK